ncbi:unnamed protein product [Heterobilharzia americana]|nr:unnamed protein product [Heterobilharzia americana]
MLIKPHKAKKCFTKDRLYSSKRKGKNWRLSGILSGITVYLRHMSIILDDFYIRESCDSGFIKEINSKMRVPDRISLDPTSLSRLNAPSMPSENDNMKVPERIVMSGTHNQSSPMAFNQRGDDLIDDLESITHQHALESLPSSLVLNEINYPDLERLNIEKKKEEFVVENLGVISQ